MKLVKGDSIFCATGITSGDLVNGIKLENGIIYYRNIWLLIKTQQLSIVKKRYKNLINYYIYNKRSEFGPFVYRLGHVVFILERGVRFLLGTAKLMYFVYLIVSKTKKEQFLM